MFRFLKWSCLEVNLLSQSKYQRNKPIIMKTKIFLLIAGAAVVTLSFTFASTSRGEKKEVVTSSTAAANEPAGGFALEDK